MRQLKISSALFGIGSGASSKSSSNGPNPDSERVRASALPIYPEEKKQDDQNNENGVQESSTFLKNLSKSFRVQGCKVIQSVKPVLDKCTHIYQTGVAHSSSTYVASVEYLQEEKNLLPRIGAITGGALVGYVLGRRSLLKRLAYSTITGSAAAAICYPKEASEYLQYSNQISKKYLNVGYHFVNGITKDYIGYDLPSLKSQKTNDDSQGDKPSEDKEK